MTGAVSNACPVAERKSREVRLESAERVPHAWRRFERAVPNQLWQMDFKGHVALAQGHGRVHPLTVLDDHSRYAIGLEGGWISPTTAKMIPATIADRPAQRRRFVAVVFIFISLI